MTDMVDVGRFYTEKPICFVQVIKAIKEQGDGFSPEKTENEKHKVLGTYKALMDTGANGCGIVKELVGDSEKSLGLYYELKKDKFERDYKLYAAYIKLLNIDQYRNTLFLCRLLGIPDRDGPGINDPEELDNDRQFILGRNFLKKSKFTYDGQTGNIVFI